MKVRIKWIENASFLGESESGHAFVMDGAPEGGGRNLGPRPMETVLIGTGGCTAYDVVHILRKSRAPVSDGPSSPCASSRRRRASRWESVSRTDHICKTSWEEMLLPVQPNPSFGWIQVASVSCGCGSSRRLRSGSWSRIRTASMRFSRRDSTRSE